eukprot:COSAG01_NODE_7651_length_3113_cov_14.784672_2_plen_131_part_00
MLDQLPMDVLDIMFNEAERCEKIDKDVKCNKSKFNFVMKELTSIMNEMNEDMSFYDTHKFILWQAKRNYGENLEEHDYNHHQYDECLKELHRFFYFNQYDEDRFPTFRAADMVREPTFSGEEEEIIVFYN